MSRLLTDQDASFTDHAAAATWTLASTGPIVWIACPCGARMARRADVDAALASDG